MDLTRITSSPHFYDIVYAAIAFLLAFNLFEIIFLLLHKRRLEKAELKKELLKHRIATAIITEEAPAASLPPPRDHIDYESYAEAAASIIESFEGEVAGRAARLIHKKGVDAYYKGLFRNGTWYKRSHAADVLAALRLKENREFFSAVFRSETSNEVKYRLIYGLSTLVRDARDVLAVSKMLSSLPYTTAKYNEDIFFNIVTTLKLTGKEEEFGEFLRLIMRDSEVRTLVKRDCLSACHLASCERSGEVVKSYYLEFKDEPEILIACIKSLVRIGNLDIIPESLRHKDWRVRLNALKHAHQCGPEVLPELKPLLLDRNYHVRINAALALARHSAAGRDALAEAISSADKFASDAARYGLDAARRLK